MDELDGKLLKLLGHNAHQSSESMAQMLDVSSPTIRRRLNKLIQEGTLCIVGRVNPERLGLGITAVIAFDVELEKLDQAVSILSERPEIQWLSTTTGRFDVIVLACFRDHSELSDFLLKKINKVEGLRNIETSICLDVSKGNLISP